MDDTIFCAVKGHKVEERVCTGIIMKADAATIQTCRTCKRGAALASTTSIEVKQLDSAAVAASAAQPARNRAWELIAERTGCTTQEKLAKKIGGTYQSKISQIMVKLGKGIMPSGRTWDRLLEISGLMPEELLLAAGHMPSAKARAESSPGPLRSCRNAFSSQPPAPPVASSLPTPSGPADLSPSAPEGPAGHMMAMQDADVPDWSGTPRITVQGSEDAEEMLDAAEIPGKGLFDPNVGDYVPLETEGEALAEGASSPAVFEQGLFAETPDPQIASEGQAIPDDFQAYTGGNRAMISSPPALNVKVTGDVELSAGAVREFGLRDVRRVQLLWSAARGQVGIVTMDEAGPGVLTLQNGRGPMRKRIAARAFFRCFGVNPAPGTYPMERHPSGLLVATITQQPAQGGEA